MEFKEYTELKKLVGKKIELEKAGNIKSPEYKSNYEKIHNFINNLTEKSKKFLKISCEQDYINNLYISKSDIDPNYKKIVEDRMDLLFTCSLLLNQKVVSEKPDIQLEK